MIVTASYKQLTDRSEGVKKTENMGEIIGRTVWITCAQSVAVLRVYQQQPTQMPRQTAPMGTFILPTTAPVVPLCCPSHPLRCSYSSLWRKGVIFFCREGGGEIGSWMPSSIPPIFSTSPKPSVEPLYAPSQLPRGAGDSPPLWRPREPWRIPQMERGNRQQRPQPCRATKRLRVRKRNMAGKERERWGEGRQRETTREGDEEGETRKKKVVLV